MAIHLEWELNDTKKIQRAKTVNLFSVNAGNCLSDCCAECIGSSGVHYHVTLERCDCIDYARNRKPCKHMIRLAMEVKAINEYGLTRAQEYDRWVSDLARKVALAAGYYHVFKHPIISDKEYNALKYELWDNCSLVPPEYELVDEKDYPVATTQKCEKMLDMSFEEFVKKYAIVPLDSD